MRAFMIPILEFCLPMCVWYYPKDDISRRCPPMLWRVPKRFHASLNAPFWAPVKPRPAGRLERAWEFVTCDRWWARTYWRRSKFVREHLS